MLVNSFPQPKEENAYQPAGVFDNFKTPSPVALFELNLSEIGIIS
jgi:hypothetical protein